MLEARAKRDKGRRPYSRKEVEEAFLDVTSATSSEPEDSVIEVIGEPGVTKDAFLRMASGARKEVMLLLPSAMAFHREEKIGIIDLLEKAAHRGVWVQILSPMDAAVRASLDRMNQGLAQDGRPLLELTESTETRRPGTVTVFVVDRSATLVIEQVRPGSGEFVKAIGSSTYSTSAPTVLASIRFFERVKEETTLRRREEAVAERERRAKAQAQLLRDILVHDIRNYNQITRSSAEALRDGASQADTDLVDAIIRATDGSTTLVEKSAKLSRIVAGGSPKLHPTSLRDSIARSLSLIAQANPNRSILLSSPLEADSVVMADELLDEVFVNLISNAVRYTESRTVPLEVLIEPRHAGAENGGTRRQGFVKVSVIDRGRGINEQAKPHIFTRYQNSAGGGTGLGLSIVHALVVERYGGCLEVADRVDGNHKMGTRVTVTLKSSERPR